MAFNTLTAGYHSRRLMPKIGLLSVRNGHNVMSTHKCGDRHTGSTGTCLPPHIFRPTPATCTPAATTHTHTHTHTPFNRQASTHDSQSAVTSTSRPVPSPDLQGKGVHINRHSQVNKKTAIGLNSLTRALELLLLRPPRRPPRRVEKPQKRNVKVMSMKGDLFDSLRGGEPHLQQKALRRGHTPQARATLAQQALQEAASSGGHT